MHRFRFVALAAALLVVAGGGTAVAQSGIIITSPDQLANSVVTQPKLGGEAVATGNLRNHAVSQLKQTNPHMTARVSASGSKLSGDASAVKRLARGHYRMTFPVESDLGRPQLNSCTTVVSPEFDIKSGSFAPKALRAYPLTAVDSEDVDVFTFEDVNGVGMIAADAAFHLVVAC